MGVGSGLYVYDIAVKRKTFSFSISFSDELLFKHCVAKKNDGLVYAYFSSKSYGCRRTVSNNLKR